MYRSPQQSTVLLVTSYEIMILCGRTQARSQRAEQEQEQVVFVTNLEEALVRYQCPK